MEGRVSREGAPCTSPPQAMQNRAPKCQTDQGWAHEDVGGEGIESVGGPRRKGVIAAVLASPTLARPTHPKRALGPRKKSRMAIGSASTGAE